MSLSTPCHEQLPNSRGHTSVSSSSSRMNQVSSATHMYCPPVLLPFAVPVWTLIFYILVLYHPKLHSVLEVRLHQCKLYQYNHFPQTTGYTVLQETVDIFGFQGTLLTLIKITVNQNLCSSLCRAAVQPLAPHSINSSMIIPWEGIMCTWEAQNLAFALVKFHRVGDCSVLSPIKISL